MFVCIHRRNWDCEAMLRSPRSRMWFMLLVCATSSMTSRKRTRERLNLGWQCWKTVRHSWTHPILCTQKCQPEQSLIAIYLIYSIIFAIYLLFSMTWYIFGLINLQIWYIYIYIYIYIHVGAIGRSAHQTQFMIPGRDWALFAHLGGTEAIGSRSFRRWGHETVTKLIPWWLEIL